MYFLELIPIALSLMSIFCDDKYKLLKLNVLLCSSLLLLMIIHSSIGGTISMTLAVASSIYVIFSGKEIGAYLTATLIASSVTLLIAVELFISPGGVSALQSLPLITFALYRYGELYCKEVGYRICMIVGGTVFVIFSLVIGSWGAAISEAVWALSSTYYLFKRSMQTYTN